MLRGSFCCGYGDFKFSRHGQTTRPAYRADLTYRVTSTEQNKSVSLPAKGKCIARWTDSGADMTSGRKRRLLCNGGDTSCVGTTTSLDAKAGRLPCGASRAVTWKATGSDCLHRKDADRLSHQMYPTRQSGEATDCSGTLGQCTRTPRSGTGTARRRCTCQHRGGEGLEWIAW
jgi:hypothetical protein